MFFFLAFGLLILWRVAKISLVEGDMWRNQGGKYVKLIDVEAERGNILSEDGSLLATSNQFFEIRIDPSASKKKDFYKHVDSLSYYLSRYADEKKTPEQWSNFLKKKRRAWEVKAVELTKPKEDRNAYLIKQAEGSRNILLAKKANYNLYEKFRKFPLLRLGANRGGFINDKFSTREKPFKSWASRTIGEDRKNAVKVGLEGYFENHLKGVTDQKLMKRIVGNVWLPIHDPTELEVKKGDDVLTTIDIDIQDIVHNELLSTVVEQEAEAGVAMVMEVETGEIKAISNFEKTKSGKYAESYNHAIGSAIEPGSTFKVATVLSLLNDGYATLDTKVDLQGGKAKFSDLWMYDSDMHGLRDVDLRTVFQKSSNVGMAKLANKAYNKNLERRKKFIANLEAFGLNQKTNIKIHGEANAYIKHPERTKKDWYGTTIPWMAHGYELRLTPIQLLTLYNTIANDGVEIKPYVVKEILRDGETIHKYKPQISKQPIASIESIKRVQELLEGTVLKGTASKLKSDKYDFAGKTGTSRVNYNSDDKVKTYNSSFAGYFPANNPKYTCYVIVFKPKKAFYGSAVAGPVFKAIADRCFATKIDLADSVNERRDMANVKSVPNNGIGYSSDFRKVFEYVGLDYDGGRSNRWVEFSHQQERMKIQKSKIKKSEVPDVRGMGLRDAMYVLENLGMDVEAYGMGKVNKQTISPGEKIVGQKIELYLN